MEITRIYFTTELHGSQTCFNKLCHVPALYDVKTVLIGGDLTGSHFYCAGEDKFRELQADESKISALFQHLRKERVSKSMRVLREMCEQDLDLRIMRYVSLSDPP
jgi:Icc-related predicted phosphoesterase